MFVDEDIPMTESEIKQQQKLTRLRRDEELRKERYFNAKRRIIGNDREGLEKQIEEKKFLKQIEKEKEYNFNQKRMGEVHIGNKLQEFTDETRRQIAKEMDDYRLNEQKPCDRREYDLNDPKAISKQWPMRFDDITDPRELTKSSFLTFQSADYDGENVRALKKHQWQCLAKQITENLMNRQNHNLEHLQIGKDTMKNDELMNKAMKLVEQKRGEAARKTMEYNLRKAEQDRKNKKVEKQNENEDNLVHNNTSINSTFFNDDGNASKSSLGYRRFNKQNYKGFTTEQKHEITAYQHKQVEELKERKKAENEEANQWFQVENIKLQVKFEQEKNCIEKRKALNRALFQDNIKLAGEQQVQRLLIQKMASENFPTDEYFDWFNKSTR